MHPKFYFSIFSPIPSHVSLSYSCSLDSGIYDSWNLALSRVNSPFITFLGFDDYFLNPTSLDSLLTDDIPTHRSIIIPSTQSITYRTRYLSSNLFVRMIRLIRGMPIPHSSSIFTSDLFHRNFNPSYKIAGDFAHLLHYYSSVRILFKDINAVSIGADGISSRNSSFLNKCFTETVSIFLHSKYIYILPFYILSYTLNFLKHLLR